MPSDTPGAGRQADVVIVAYNRYELTDSCMRHLRGQQPAHRLIVVDNGSTDETSSRLPSDWPDAEVIRLERNSPFAVACNAGVRAGDAPFVVLLNNDFDSEPDFLERVLAPFTGNERLGSVATLCVQPGGEYIDSVGLAADPTLAGFPRLQGLPVARAADPLPVLTGPAGTAAAYRRAAWEQVEGLDEAIFAYMEDFDLALRLRSVGWETVAEPRATGVHLGSATHGHRSAWQRENGGFARGYLLRRYGSLRRLVAARTLATEAVVVIGDIAISHDAAALRGRLRGWRAARGRTRRAWPPAEAIDSGIGFRQSLNLRRGVYGRRAV